MDKTVRVGGRVDKNVCVGGRVDKNVCVGGRVDKNECVGGRVDKNVCVGGRLNKNEDLSIDWAEWRDFFSIYPGDTLEELVDYWIHTPVSERWGADLRGQLQFVFLVTFTLPAAAVLFRY